MTLRVPEILLCIVVKPIYTQYIGTSIIEILRSRVLPKLICVCALMMMPARFVRICIGMKGIVDPIVYFMWSVFKLELDMICLLRLLLKYE